MLILRFYFNFITVKERICTILLITNVFGYIDTVKPRFGVFNNVWEQYWQDMAAPTFVFTDIVEHLLGDVYAYWRNIGKTWLPRLL